MQLQMQLTTLLTLTWQMCTLLLLSRAATPKTKRMFAIEASGPQNL